MGQSFLKSIGYDTPKKTEVMVVRWYLAHIFQLSNVSIFFGDMIHRDMNAILLMDIDGISWMDIHGLDLFIGIIHDTDWFIDQPSTSQSPKLGNSVSLTDN